MNIKKLFFELLQIAIGSRDTLSVTPTKDMWAELFTLAKKQALVGVCFVAIQRLNPSEALHLSEFLRLQWLGMAAKIQQRNQKLNEACASLCKDLAHNGLYACILKGQSNLVNYPEYLREYRTPGDIDVWCGLMDPDGIDIAVLDLDGKGAHYEKYDGERGVIEWVLADWRMKFTQKCQTPLCKNEMPEVQYHHVDWEYKGIECEVHFRTSWMNNPWHNRRLQRWCKENEQWNTCDYDGFNIPSVGFNAVYQLVHIYRHLFNEGIGLRQLLDYYFVLKEFTQGCQTPLCKNERQSMGMWDEGMGISARSKEEILHTLGRFGMKEFAGAVMFVLQKVFAMPSEYMLCAPDANRGEFLLNEIMLAGNFGKFDERNVIGQHEGYLRRFVRRQKRFVRFLGQYPSEVIWGPYFSIKQRVWRELMLWRY